MFKVINFFFFYYYNLYNIFLSLIFIIEFIQTGFVYYQYFDNTHNCDGEKTYFIGTASGLCIKNPDTYTSYKLDMTKGKC